METPNNRQVDPANKRGRPRKEVVEARPEPIPADPIPLPVGRICPCCGRGMVPKVLRGTNDVKYCACTLCGGKFKMWSLAGRWMAQPL
jgi:hypothetical protein